MKQSPLLNIIFNVVLPSVILSKLSKPEYLGQTYALILAISFPLAYGLRDLIKEKKWNFFSIMGLLSVGMTGGLGLLQVGKLGFAIKEAAFPLIIGLTLIFSLKSQKPLVQTLFFNEQVFNIEKMKAAFVERNNSSGMALLVKEATYLMSATLFLSSFLNFALAIYVLNSPPGTPEFNEELGKMTAMSYPVITIPSMISMMLAMWRIAHQIKKNTGLGLEELMADPKANKDSVAPKT